MSFHEENSWTSPFETLERDLKESRARHARWAKEFVLVGEPVDLTPVLAPKATTPLLDYAPTICTGCAYTTTGIDCIKYGTRPRLFTNNCPMRPLRKR